jgi:prophage maintenance system killer protein
LGGTRSPQQLAAAATQPQQSAFGEDAYATIPAKAAAYGYFIADAQAFIDGNQCTWHGVTLCAFQIPQGSGNPGTNPNL